jgi:hypothetical protein
LFISPYLAMFCRKKKYLILGWVWPIIYLGIDNHREIGYDWDQGKDSVCRLFRGWLCDDCSDLRREKWMVIFYLL